MRNKGYVNDYIKYLPDQYKDDPNVWFQVTDRGIIVSTINPKTGKAKKLGVMRIRFLFGDPMFTGIGLTVHYQFYPVGKKSTLTKTLGKLRKRLSKLLKSFVDNLTYPIW